MEADNSSSKTDSRLPRRKQKQKQKQILASKLFSLSGQVSVGGEWPGLRGFCFSTS